MKILITGGTGRIGANLAQQLLAKGHRIRSFVYLGDASRANKLDGFENVETVKGDLRNFDDVKRATEGVDAIVHLAAAFGGPFDNRQYLDINAMGTLNILECIREGLPKLHRLVYACTEAVYWKLGEHGRYFEKPITEEMVAKRHHMPYFLTKWIGEELCMTYHLQYDVPTTVFRFSTVIEPSEFLDEEGLPRRFFLNTAIKQWEQYTTADATEQEILDELLALRSDEEKLLLAKNPNGVPHSQQFADVRDIVDGLVLGLEKDAAVGEEFTLAGPAIFDWSEIIPYLSERYNIPYVEARLPYKNYFTLDLSKIRNMLGHDPKYDFYGILETAEAMRRGETTDVIPTGVRWGT